MNGISINILQRMSLFGDSKMLAHSLRNNPDEYFLVEAAAHIDGLWEYSVELAQEIKRLQQMLKEKPVHDSYPSTSLFKEQAKTVANRATADISAGNPVCIPEYQLPQSVQPTTESSLQKLALIQNCENHHAQERAKCSVEDALCPHKTKGQPLACTEPQYEYLTLALPMKPNHSVQIYGQAKNTPTQFLPLAELSLTMLRDQAIRMVNASPHAVRNQFDTFSRAAIYLTDAMNSPSARHRSKEEDH
jgi:hypothetical protein